MTDDHLYPGDHVQCHWNSEAGTVRGILLRTYVNGTFGTWARVWTDDGEYDSPLDEWQLIASPRQEDAYREPGDTRRKTITIPPEEPQT